MRVIKDSRGCTVARIHWIYARGLTMIMIIKLVTNCNKLMVIVIVNISSKIT